MGRTASECSVGSGSSAGNDRRMALGISNSEPELLRDAATMLANTVSLINNISNLQVGRGSILTEGAEIALSGRVRDSMSRRALLLQQHLASGDEATAAHQAHQIRQRVDGAREGALSAPRVSPHGPFGPPLLERVRILRQQMHTPNAQGSADPTAHAPFGPSLHERARALRARGTVHGRLRENDNATVAGDLVRPFGPSLNERARLIRQNNAQRMPFASVPVAVERAGASSSSGSMSNGATLDVDARARSDPVPRAAFRRAACPTAVAPMDWRHTRGSEVSPPSWAFVRESLTGRLAATAAVGSTDDAGEREEPQPAVASAPISLEPYPSPCAASADSDSEETRRGPPCGPLLRHHSRYLRTHAVTAPRVREEPSSTSASTVDACPFGPSLHEQARQIRSANPDGPQSNESSVAELDGTEPAAVSVTDSVRPFGPSLHEHACMLLPNEFAADERGALGERSSSESLLPRGDECASLEKGTLYANPQATSSSASIPGLPSASGPTSGTMGRRDRIGVMPTLNGPNLPFGVLNVSMPSRQPLRITPLRSPVTYSPT